MSQTLPLQDKRKGSLLEVLKIAMPLIMASAGNALNLFTDRLMLARYSQDAVSASFPAGLTAFALSCFFIGTVGYANSFVAQYIGAKRPERVGTAVWQGIFIALIGGAVMALGYFWAQQLFDFFGHKQSVRILEVEYYRILAIGTVIPLLMVACSTFWGGQGKTSMIMIVNLLVTAFNIPLNYLMIYGSVIKLPFGVVLEIPEMGIRGAAWGTVLSGFLGLCIFLVFLFLPEQNRRVYGTCSNLFDWDLFKRVMRFGSPNGVQLFLDLTAFNAFVVILGRINVTVQEASSIAFALNSIAFIPMIGIGQTVGILVGQSVGAGDIPHAMRAVKNARTLVLLYMAFMALLFVVYPDPILAPFIRPNDPSQIEAIIMTRKMLCFIAAYLLFDGFFIIYGNAIKGAGDTKFAMWMGAGMAWFLFAIPCMVAYYYNASVWYLWTITVLYIMTCGLVFYARYRGGKWKTMKVIESEANDHPRGAIPKEPGVENFLP